MISISMKFLTLDEHGSPNGTLLVEASPDATIDPKNSVFQLKFTPGDETKALSFRLAWNDTSGLSAGIGNVATSNPPAKSAEMEPDPSEKRGS